MMPHEILEIRTDIKQLLQGQATLLERVDSTNDRLDYHLESDTRTHEVLDKRTRTLEQWRWWLAGAWAAITLGTGMLHLL